MAMEPADFFTEYGEANRYTIKEVIGKGSYGVVCSATDNLTGETVSLTRREAWRSCMPGLVLSPCPAQTITCLGYHR
jgi:hypothetical protein